MIRHQRCKPDVDEEANQFARSIPGDSSRLSDNFNNPWWIESVEKNRIATEWDRKTWETTYQANAKG